MCIFFVYFLLPADERPAFYNSHSIRFKGINYESFLEKNRQIIGGNENS